MTLFLGLFLIGILGLSCLSTGIFKQQDQALAQQSIQTTKSRNLAIDLGNGLKTSAQLTLPAVGNGPFPGVLLIHGSGGESVLSPIQPYTPIAEYLSERGFAVLQYNKRGIGENDTLDSNVWGNLTINDLKQDAEKALNVLIQQPEVDAKRITVLGHSEGTTIAPRIAIDNPGKVKNVVLMAAIAQNMRDLLYFQVVMRPVDYAQQILDHNHNGLISVQEASKNPVFSTLVGNLTLLLTQNITTANGTSKQLSPQFDVNNDTFVSIDKELKPRLIDRFRSMSVVTPGEKCVSLMACPILLKSHYALQPPISNLIGNISSNTSILILQGENDSNAPIQQAFLLQQKLTEVNHPDHTLITYPDLGHWFNPSSQWFSTSTGPISQYVLADLYSWLESHSGLSHPYVGTIPTSTLGANTTFSAKR
jgi:pimeloyl-ACP methyl ester carboxylesterase